MKKQKTCITAKYDIPKMQKQYTCKKRAYLGTHVVWDGSNTEKVRELFDDVTEVTALGVPYLMIRGESWLSTMRVNDVLVVGMNGVVKLYTAEDFSIKYETLE